MKYKNLSINEAEDSFITIVDDEGNEELCQIIFTLDSEELGKKYVIFSRVSDIEKYYNSGDDSDEQIEVGAAAYVEGPNGEGDLQEIESDEEWELIEDALEQFDEQCCSEDGCCCGEHCHCEDGTEVCECDEEEDCCEGGCCCCHPHKNEEDK